MLKVKSCPVELRGIENKVSEQGKVYYLLYCELDSGKPYKFYIENSSVFPEGLRKGDMVTVTFELSYYKGFERLSVVRVDKEA